MAISVLSQEAWAQRLLGTDVSAYQPNVDWTAVKNAGVTFAWAKATEGTGWKSGYFAAQEAGAAQVGILIGAYHFARPSSHPNITGPNSADTEAQYFWSVAGPYIKTGGTYLVPMLDWEDTSATVAAGFTSAATMSAWVNEWCYAVSNYAAAAGVFGLRPVIYTGAWFSRPSGTYPGLTTAVTNWPSWISYYPYSDGKGGYGTPHPLSDPFPSSYYCYPWTSANIWQYGDTNWSGGDSDVFAGNLSSFMQMFAVGGGGNNATYVSSSVPGSVLTGATFTASITLNNSGSTTWTNTGANPYRLGSQNAQDNTTWGFSRVALPSSPISPGANATFTFTATAPSTPGVYHFSWRLLQEGAQWFGDTFSLDIVVKMGGAGTSVGTFTYDSGAMQSTSRDPNYVAFTTTCTPSASAWWSVVCDGRAGYGTNFSRDIRWMPSLAGQNAFTGRGLVVASAFVPSGVPNSYGNGTAAFFGVDPSGADLPGPLSGSINECVNATCRWVNAYSNAVNLSTTLGGFRSNTTNDSAAASGGCSTSCGYYSVVYSQMRIQAARWQYIDDWTCLGPYASSSVTDTANRAFTEANLYLYPAVDTSHGNVIATLLGLNGKTPGHVTTGDCNNANSLNFGSGGNAVAYGNANNADAYGFAWVYAPAGAWPQFLIGSDDGNRVWINGTLVNDNNASRPLTRDQDNTGMKQLVVGWNRILFKVHNGTSGWQGTLSLRNGNNTWLNEPDVNVFDLGGYYSYGLGYEQDDWYPRLVISSLNGTSSPANGTAFYGNTTTVTASGTSSVTGPVPYWRTMHYQWGYGLGSADTSYADVSGTPTSASWSHTATGVTGHRRLHFFAVSRSGRTSFQSSGLNGGSVFQDTGNYARYYDVYVDNVPPLAPAFTNATATVNQISLGWPIPLDQGVNVGVGSTESAGAGGNQDAQNWYRVGDVGVQLYRNGSVLSGWSSGTAATDSGLAANTAYTYTLEARDNSTNKRGTWHNSTGQQDSTTVWTLSVPPAAGSITGSPANPHSGSNVTWTAVSGFGAGKVQYYRYAWDTSPVHTWTDTEPQWLAGTLTTMPTSAGTWYLHVKGYNGADVGNDSFDYALTATASASATTLVSSQNPAGAGSNVTFTATVSAVAPETATPTGDVVFAANGAPFSTNALVNGSASATTASLLGGTTTVAAQYSGDLFFLGSSDSLQQVIDAASSQTNAIVGIADNQNGTFTLTFAGTPHAQYYVVETAELTPSTAWAPVSGSTNTVLDPSGLWTCTVTNTGGQRFYRSVALMPAP